MTTNNNFRVKNGLEVAGGNIIGPNGLSIGGSYVNVTSTSTNDIDLYTNNWEANGVEVWLQHNNQVAINTANGAYSWAFKKDGTQAFPQLTTPHAGTGQTLRFTDPTQQVIITNSTATETYPNSQRIVIQGSEGYASGGEGGDIYLWAGNSGAGGGSGGDIKIDAGYGYSDSDGGTIKIRAGASDGGNGGFVDIHGGQGVDSAGPVRIYSGDGNQQLNIDNSGVKISNAYTLPTTVGSEGYVMTTDGYGNVSWAAGSGGSTSTFTSITLGGNYDNTAQNNIVMGNSVIGDYSVYIGNDPNNTLTLLQWDNTNYPTAKLIIQMVDADTRIHSMEMMVVNINGNSYSSISNIIKSDTDLGTWSADVTGSNIVMSLTTANDITDLQVRISYTLIKH